MRKGKDEALKKAEKPTAAAAPKAKRVEKPKLVAQPMRSARILVALAIAVEVIVFIGIGATTNARARLSVSDLIVAGAMLGTTLVQVLLVMLIERARAKRRARKAAAAQPSVAVPAPEPVVAAPAPQPPSRSERPLIIDDPKPAAAATPAGSRTYAPLRAPIPAVPAAEPRPVITSAPATGPLAARAAARAALLEWSVPAPIAVAPVVEVDPTASWTTVADPVAPAPVAGPEATVEPPIVEASPIEAPAEDVSEDVATVDEAVEDMRASALSLIAPAPDPVPAEEAVDPLIDERLALLAAPAAEASATVQGKVVDDEVTVVVEETVATVEPSAPPAPVVDEPISELAGLVRALDALRVPQAPDPVPAPQSAQPAPVLTFEDPTPPSPSRVRVRLDLDLDADGFAALLRALEQGDVVGVPRQPGLQVIHGGRSAAAN